MKGFPLLRQSCLIALLSFSGSVLSAEQNQALDLDSLQPTRDQVIASLNTVELLRRHHYNRIRLDDDLSAQIYDTYIKQLDPQRSLTRWSEIRQDPELPVEAAGQSTACELRWLQ